MSRRPSVGRAEVKAQWTSVGVGRFRSWTLRTASGVELAKIYAGTRPCSYLIHDHGGQELLFNNTSEKLSDHKRLVASALRRRFKLLESVFGSE